MIEDGLCTFSDLPPEQCIHCKPAAPKVERPPVDSTRPRFRRSGTLLAEFPGRCPGCDEAIEPGDHIKRDASDDWCHEECA